ncbi:MAG: serine hydrolase domain-containing protein [Cyclobacteriaceae bacterium]
MRELIMLISTILMVGNAHGQLKSDSPDLELKELYESSDLPGFAVAIVNHEGVLYQGAFGYADLDSRRPYTINTLQNIGSVTKTFVGLAVIHAIEDEVLSMNMPINDLLPFDVVNPYFQESPILLRHLLNHTSGIVDSKYYGKSYLSEEGEKKRAGIHEGYLSFIEKNERISLAEFLERILSADGKWYRKKNFKTAEPGLAMEYSNLNAALAAYLVELATKTPFDEYVQEEILNPLEMNNSGWRRSDINRENQAALYFPGKQIVPHYSLITYPDGGLISSVNDLSGYLVEMIKAFSGKSNYLKGPYARMLLPGDSDGDRAFWGMGEKSKNIGHGGSDPGVQTDMQFNAYSRIGRIIFTNVNAEDNEELEKQYRQIHTILSKYESGIN